MASKYGNRKVEYDGMKFDSIREKNRWIELTLLQAGGVIRGLERQKRWPLYGGRPSSGTVPVQVAVYVADYDYEELTHANTDAWEHVTEDCKGVRTAVYRLKAKLFAANYGRAIRET